MINIVYREVSSYLDTNKKLTDLKIAPLENQKKIRIKRNKRSISTIAKPISGFKDWTTVSLQNASR